MNKAKILTNLSIAVGVLALLVKSYAWLRAYMAGGLTAEHWFMDAIVLMLAAIWLKLGAIYHKNG